MNGLNETVLLSTQKHLLKLMSKKIITILRNKFPEMDLCNITKIEHIYFLRNHLAV